VDRERVDTAGEFSRKNPIDHTVTLDPGLIFERIRHDIDPEMSLPARPGAGMALMLVGFVRHPQALRCEGFGQFLCDQIGGAHPVT
jgi:hypothetical protein